MKGKAPFLTEVIFFCPTCGKKKRVDVEVWITLKKNYFTFECKKCKNRWIIDVCETKINTLPVGSFSSSSEPQIQFINRFTNELHPMLRKEIVEKGKIRIVRSIGETNEIQALGIVKIDKASLFDLSGELEGLGRIGTGVTRNKMGSKIRGLRK